MTHIWVPKVKILEGEISTPKGRLAGQYTIKKYKTGFKEPVQIIGPFDNLITNTGLDAIGSEYCNYVFVGTGTAAPNVTDDQLGNFVKETNTTVEGGWNSAILRGGSPDYWVQGAGTYRFAQGDATGTFTEVGFGYLAPPGGGQTIADRHRCFSRALIVDGNGSPNPITVAADEYLDVTYSIKFYPYIGADIVQSLNLSGTSHTVTSRALGVETNNYTVSNPIFYQTFSSSSTRTYTGTAPGTPPALASVTATALLNAGISSNLSTTTEAYIQGSYEMVGTVVGGLDQGNFTYGIRGMTVACTTTTGTRYGAAAMTFQSTIDPPIMKDGTKVLQFGIKYGWARK